MYTGEDIKQKRAELSQNILKGFFSDELEKAHQQGDTHPNGKWYWETSAAGGKGDWRVIGGRKQSKPKSNKIMVTHNKFGRGEVVSDDGANVTVKFEDDVEKKFVKKYVNLTKDDGKPYYEEENKPEPKDTFKKKNVTVKQSAAKPKQTTAQKIASMKDIILAVNDKWNNNSGAKLAEYELGKIPDDAPDIVKNIADTAIDIYIGNKKRKQNKLTDKQAYVVAKYLVDNNL